MPLSGRSITFGLPKLPQRPSRCIPPNHPCNMDYSPEAVWFRVGLRETLLRLVIDYVDLQTSSVFLLPNPPTPHPVPRVNSDVLMRTASSCASPIIHAVTRAVALHTSPVVADSSMYGSRGTGPAGGHIPCGGSALSANGAVQSFSALSSQHSSVLSRGRTGRQDEMGQVGAGLLPGGAELRGVDTA